MPQAQAEALAAFGDGGIYVEKLIEGGRHIEVQVLGDGTDVIHCFERECSLQRRRQKVWEEAPSPSLTPAIREKLCLSAVALAKAVHYRGAGTLEYLYDDRSHAFYFLEMNTRIQVEHPVTEMVTGIDLVREMIRIAGGERLRIRQDQVRVIGHSIEVRINAEDPANGFAPNPGTVTALSVPGGNGVRFDSMLYAGYTVPPFYDSLLGKLIVHDEDRASAIRRLDRALGELNVEGLATTRSLHRALVRDPRRPGRAVSHRLARTVAGVAYRKPRRRGGRAGAPSRSRNRKIVRHVSNRRPEPHANSIFLRRRRAYLRRSG